MEISATIKGLGDLGGDFYQICICYLADKGSQRMMVDYCKLKQMVTQIIVAILDMASLLEQTNVSPAGLASSYSWYGITARAN